MQRRPRKESNIRRKRRLGPLENEGVYAPDQRGAANGRIMMDSGVAMLATPEAGLFIIIARKGEAPLLWSSLSWNEMAAVFEEFEKFKKMAGEAFEKDMAAHGMVKH